MTTVGHGDKTPKTTFGRVVALSSGAEYLDELRLHYVKYKDLPEALESLANGQSNAIVNSLGALQYFVSKRYSKFLEMPKGLLAPAYMAVARRAVLCQVTRPSDRDELTERRALLRISESKEPGGSLNDFRAGSLSRNLRQLCLHVSCRPTLATSLAVSAAIRGIP
jgi:Bacterial extracellular solute-binding proteins, family 3